LTHCILVPLDGSDHALKALHFACDMAEKYHGEIALLHVLLEDKTPDDILNLTMTKKFGPSFETALRASVNAETGHVSVAMLERMGEHMLEDASKRVLKRNIYVNVLRIADGDPAERILKALRDLEANTIVMGCRGTGSTEKSPFGSVSHKVFAEADCTCIAVK
jgi:nucleotide-binding universal stress UspA family protein